MFKSIVSSLIMASMVAVGGITLSAAVATPAAASKCADANWGSSHGGDVGTMPSDGTGSSNASSCVDTPTPKPPAPKPPKPKPVPKPKPKPVPAPKPVTPPSNPTVNVPNRVVTPKVKAPKAPKKKNTPAVAVVEPQEITDVCPVLPAQAEYEFPWLLVLGGLLLAFLAGAASMWAIMAAKNRQEDDENVDEPVDEDVTV